MNYRNERLLRGMLKGIIGIEIVACLYLDPGKNIQAIFNYDESPNDRISLKDIQEFIGYNSEKLSQEEIERRALTNPYVTRIDSNSLEEYNKK